MGLLQERDCHQLGNAGHEARKRGILSKRKSLTCPHIDCDQINCKLVEDPPVRTVYVASVQTPPMSQTDKFFQRLQAYADRAGTPR
jgi:hypothetical protein